MATHSSILAWKIPQTDKPGRLMCIGSQRVRHDWWTEHACNHHLSHGGTLAISASSLSNIYPFSSLKVSTMLTSEAIIPTCFCVFFTRQHCAVVRTWILRTEGVHSLLGSSTHLLRILGKNTLSLCAHFVCDVKIMTEWRPMRLFKRLTLSWYVCGACDSTLGRMGALFSMGAKLLRRVWLFVTPWTVSPPGSSVHGILQARTLEWTAISFSRGSSWPRDQSHVSCIGRWVLYH